MAENKTGKILMWVGIGCGTLLLLVVGSCVGLYYYGKHKLASEIAKTDPKLAEAIRQGGMKGGLTGAGGQMIAAAVGMYGGAVALPQLPKAEQEQARAVFEHLAKVGTQLKAQDLEALGKALERIQEPHKADRSQPTPEEVRAFITEVKAVGDQYTAQP